MNLDDADLAILETSLDALDEPLARGIAQSLIDAVREYQATTEEVEKTLETARSTIKDGLGDARIALGHLREHIKEAPPEADRYADEVEEQLDKLSEWETA